MAAPMSHSRTSIPDSLIPGFQKSTAQHSTTTAASTLVPHLTAFSHFNCAAPTAWLHIHTSVGRLLDSRKQRVVSGVESHGEGTVDDVAVDLCSKVQLHYVVVLQHGFVPHVGRPVRCHVIQTAPGRKGNASLRSELKIHVEAPNMQTTGTERKWLTAEMKLHSLLPAGHSPG
jgi:hypothetical protein